MSKIIKVNIDGKIIEVEEGTSILNAAKIEDIDIPNLCYDERLDIKTGQACRICMVEVEGSNKLFPSCGTQVFDGMVVKTDTENLKNIRRMLLELILVDHPLDCMTCNKNGNCKLQDYCYRYDVKGSRFSEFKKKDTDISNELDNTNEFYYFDASKCILCGKCVRICSELQCVDAIELNGRSDNIHVAPEFDKNLKDSSCVSCGNCVSVCPVGALMPKYKEKFRTWEVSKVRTTCPYCGVGCQMYLIVKDNKVVGVEPVEGKLANDGLLCVKGKFGSGFINHSDRLKTPLIKKDGKFIEVGWDEAISLIAEKVKEAKENNGADSCAGFSSARCTNEENYLFQKMVRAVFKTNNVDHCARLCHASTVAGLATTFGSGAMTNSIREVLGSDVIYISGSNTTETHPVIGANIKQALKNGAKLIVAEPRMIELAARADVFLQIKPGTNVAINNGIMQVIIEEGLQDKEYIKKLTENYEALEEIVKNYTPERVGKICGVDPEDIKKAARLYAGAKKASIFFSMGVTQHSTGTHGVMSMANLAMLCGNVGIESGGVNPLRGQNNVQGACDLGALPGDLPGYQKVNNSEIIKKFEKAWGTKLSTEQGLTITEIMKNGEEGKIKFLYIMGENPMISDPDLNHVKKALEKIDFVVVQDIFLSETAQLADVVLPAACFAEKDGTFTNTERRVQRVRKAINLVGKAKPDWEILMLVMNKLGYNKVYKNPSEIMDEINSVTPSYGGITYDRIDEDGLQWPCLDKNHSGTKYLHKDKFVRGLGLFQPHDYIESAELPDDNYPYILTTGRILYHYHTRTMTSRVEGLNKLYPKSYIEINPIDADNLSVNDGDRVKVSSRRGEVVTTVKVENIIEKGVVFMPFHFSDGAANYLTNSAVDPIAKIPEFKVCAVNIEQSI